MPNIRTYEAPNVSISPSERGSAAFGQSGRRLGPLYNEAAQFTRQAGALAADNKAQLWPLDILEMYQRQAEAAAREAAGQPSGGGGGARARRGRDFAFSSPASYGPGFYSPIDENGRLIDANTQIGRGAAVLGQALSDGGDFLSTRRRGGAATQRGGVPPVGSSARAALMREALAFARQMEKGQGGGGPAMSLEEGYLVQADGKALQDYKNNEAKNVARWTEDAVKTQDYWYRYSGGVSSQPMEDPNTFSGGGDTQVYPREVAQPSFWSRWFSGGAPSSGPSSEVEPSDRYEVY